VKRQTSKKTTKFRELLDEVKNVRACYLALAKAVQKGKVYPKLHYVEKESASKIQEKG
jgi:hypothetical protein